MLQSQPALTPPPPSGGGVAQQLTIEAVERAGKRPRENGELVAVSLSPVHAGTRPATYSYDGLRGYELGVRGADGESSEGLPIKAARFLLSPHGEAHGRVAVWRQGARVGSGRDFTVSSAEKEGSLVWYESSFADVFEASPGDLILLDMDKESAENCSFVFANTRAGVRDLHNGVRVRAVDGKEGRDNRYSMYMEILVELVPGEAGAFKRLAE